MKLVRDKILILADDRPGTVSQSIGLAEEIGFEYEIIKLAYGFFSFLPNCLLGNSLLQLSSQSRREIKTLNYFPSLVISAGRRSAPIAFHLKNHSSYQTKIVQIMNPNLDFRKFDFVILPKHDEIDESNFPNLITTIGALTKINKNIILSESEKFSSWFQNIAGTKIALLVGGSSKKTKFEKDSALNLARITSEIAKNMGATVLVSTSPRTNYELAETLKLNLKCDFKFFDWKKMGGENPYLAILGYADFFIITGDSVSMISECCSTGKSVYIFDEQKISSEKHRRFHKNLFEENYAKKLFKNSFELENFSPSKLQETKRVADMIRSKAFIQTHSS